MKAKLIDIMKLEGSDKTAAIYGDADCENIERGDTEITVREMCHKHVKNDAMYYKRKSRYGGLEFSDLKRMRELEAENSRLKRMYANLNLMKDLISKKL